MRVVVFSKDNGAPQVGQWNDWIVLIGWSPYSIYFNNVDEETPVI
jgi:hypothetical protein